MNQRWWLAIVGIVAVGLVFLLFPRPDTGEDIPDPDPQNAPFKEGKRNRPKAPVDPERVATGPNPAQEAVREKRNRPEVAYATKLVTPFSAMRYTLAREGSAEAKALADEVAATMGEIRTIRLDPDAMTWEEMKTKTDAMIAKIEASKFASDPSIIKSLERYRQFIGEYEQAKSGQPVPGSSDAAHPAPGVTPGAAPETDGEAPGTPAAPGSPEE